MTYDILRRPRWKFLFSAPSEPAYAYLLEETGYGENEANNIARNLRGKVYTHVGGVARQWFPEGYDFKGNPVVAKQMLVQDKTLSDTNWFGGPAMTGETFSTTTKLDALGRPVRVTDPGNNLTEYLYDRGGALKTVRMNDDYYVNDIHYDAKGQRQAIWYGNGTKTGYTYDAFTFRLRRLLTVNVEITSDHYNEQLQDLNYYYDPVGNITRINDDAQQTIFFNNTVVSPAQNFTYDALYRLTEAKGREQKNNADFGSSDNTADSEMLSSNPLKWDSGALQLYTQQYSYDEVGNILQLKHIADTGSYTRDYNYSSSPFSRKYVLT